MKYIATKNQNKKADNHPDFRLYKKDDEGNVITEKYTKQDGTQGEAWKSFGALWIKMENGKIKSMSITTDDEADSPKKEESFEDFSNDLSDTGAEALKKKLADQEPIVDYPENNPDDIPF